MRIAVDGRVLDGHFPGIGRYVYHLVDALGKADDVQLNVLLDPSRADERFQVSHLSRHGNVELSSVPGSVFSPAAQWRMPRAIREQRADVFHATYWVTAYRPQVPTVLSLFDLIGILDPEAVSPLRRVALRVALRLAVRCADLILTLSEWSRDDIVGSGLARPEDVVVAPLGVDRRFRPPDAEEVAAMRHRLGLPDSYVLYVGINKPHKNLTTLVKAWGQMEGLTPRSAGPVDTYGAALVLAGPWDSRYAEPKRIADRLPPETPVRFLGTIAEQDLPALYGGAGAFAFPSRYEGFGLPPLEAMACGTPVVASSATSLPEVVGQAGLLVDPADVEGWAVALRRVLEEPRLADELRVKGFEQAAKFTWRRTAQLTLDAYRRLARSGPRSVARCGPRQT